MKIYETDAIRNLSLLGNAGSGKTILGEAMVFNGGIINRMGDIGTKNTVSDYRAVEHEQEGSIYSTVLYTEWNDKKINILDTPGLTDFNGAVVSSLHVTDAAVMMLNAKSGVEVGTEILWRSISKFGKPTIFAVNHLDHESANFEKTIEEAKQHFGNKVTIMQYPVKVGPDFDAVIDVIKMKMLKWGKDGGKPEELPIPDSEKDKADELFNELVEMAAENDEELMEIFFEKETLSEEEMQRGIKLGVKNGGMFPVFCLSAKKNIGVTRLMDFICNVAPSPAEVEQPKTEEGEEIECTQDAPVRMFIFKSSMEPHLGEVNYFKMMSGVLKEGMDLMNVEKSNKERFSQVYAVAGKNRTKISGIGAGDIGAAVKLKDTTTNESLTEKGKEVTFPEIVFPEPKHRVAVKAVNDSDDEKLGEVLHRIHDEDPSIILEYSKELKQLIVHGQGEHHLNTMKWLVEKEHNIELQFIAPKIPYRETITKVAQSSYRHKKQSGGAGQFGEVHLVIEPYDENKPDPSQYKIGGQTINVSVRDKQVHDLAWGGKLVFYNCIVGGVIDGKFMPAILKGVMEKMEEGPLTGCYARDIRFAVYDGKMHPVDSNEISFKIAGLNAFRDAFKKAGPKIMEPVYNVEVIVPSERMGDVMSDLQGRRSIIQGMSSEGGYEKIKVKVPLAEMSNYSTALRSLTNGRATYTMSFDQYAQVPGDVQEKLLKAYEESQNEE